jgi:hypothetical protein
MLRILTAGLLVLITGAAATRPQAHQSKVSTDIQELLEWLPPDTETIQVTQTSTNPPGPLSDAMSLVRGELGDSDESFSKTLTRHLKGVRIQATLDASRHFSPPAGLGLMLSEGVSIVRFEKPLADNGTRLMADLAKSGLRVDRVDGVEIVEFRDRLENDTWTSLITMPSSDLLVIATHRGYLEELRALNG